MLHYSMYGMRKWQCVMDFAIFPRIKLVFIGLWDIHEKLSFNLKFFQKAGETFFIVKSPTLKARLGPCRQIENISRKLNLFIERNVHRYLANTKFYIYRAYE